MKKVMKKIMFVFMLGLVSQTHAAIIDTNTADPNFTFGGLDWTASFDYISAPAPTTPSTGTIRTGAEAFNGELEITGSDNGSGVASETAMYSTATADGTVSFDWSFFSTDLAGFDFFIWVSDAIGGDTTRVISDRISASESGISSFIVAAGGLFGLSIDTTDNNFGSATVDISNFSFAAFGGASAVPLPPALLLFGAALAGLGFFQKKKPLQKAI
jgi:hypothetical protein